MQVNNNTFGCSTGFPFDNIGRFTANAGQGQKFFHRRGHLAAEIIDKPLRHRTNALGLLPEKAGGVDVFFQFFLLDIQIIRRAAVFDALPSRS